jgi:hypothetical protein
MRQEYGRSGAAPLWIAWRKMDADVTVADRAEQCVGHGMEHDVGIAVAIQRPVMGNAHAAQPEMIAGRKGMNVKSHARAACQPFCKTQLRLREIRAIG